MTWQQYIHSNPDILMRKPTIKETRLSIELILEFLSNGWTEKMLFESYPTLPEEALRVVLMYLYDCIQEEMFYPYKKVA